MLVHIPGVLDKTQVAAMRADIDAAEWTDGNATSGHQSGKAKDNLQLPEDCAVAVTQGQAVMAAAERHPLFIAAALPAGIYPPLFNRYAGGQSFGAHVDNAIRRRKGTSFRIRTD